ncbi:hypothetical protein RVS70_05570 [Virgibacillus sp. M23]|uniref:hypothetical protein n=1 Tax=Virgibacillus sp. M23 TaxID=3079030 RepID=UPI002A91B2D4|nr:hypothetical protein [Virgibacillus sp. M23]MDY7043671.1 hypothetical protein [Virgibacillus sp. M23]
MSDTRDILRKAEVKRVFERLTKMELCTIYGFNYNYYSNCVSGRNSPSKKMADILKEYLDTPTREIYNMVFSSRDVDNNIFHEALELGGQEVFDIVKSLRSNEIIHVPSSIINTILESVIAIEKMDKWLEEDGGELNNKEEKLKSKINDIRNEITKMKSNTSNKDNNDTDLKEILEKLDTLESELNDLREEKELRYKLFIKKELKDIK